MMGNSLAAPGMFITPMNKEQKTTKQFPATKFKLYAAQPWSGFWHLCHISL